MEVTVPLFESDVKGTAADIAEVYRGLYNGDIVFFKEECDESGFLSAGAYEGRDCMEGFLSAGAYEGRDCMEISLHGGEGRYILVARYDNLGKGASGAAVECMNLALGIPPETGLVL